MAYPKVPIELPADYWAQMVANKEVLWVVAVRIEQQLRAGGYGPLVDKFKSERLAELKAKINEVVPGLADKAEALISGVADKLNEHLSKKLGH